MSTHRRNPQDLTLRNKQHTDGLLRGLRDRVRQLELEVRRLKHWLIDPPPAAPRRAR